MAYIYGVTIDNAYEQWRENIFEELKFSMNRIELTAFCIGYIDNTILLLLKFRHLISADFIRNIFSFCGNDNIHISALRNTREQELFSLRITAEDDRALFVGLQHSEISFLYELNQWVKDTDTFTPTDPFVIRHPEKFCFLKAYLKAKKPNCSM